VPFPYAVDDHQTSNGRFLVEAGAAELVQQSELSVERLAGLLQGLLSAPQRLHEMAQCARELARPDATGCVADACLEVAA
jgi:UDP-N-acetylglucosamine--N-acetylmuramyl-(pentapeptide) pyrophosphoryl-undecaprenol N-acetylglucosamine transferase